MRASALLPLAAILLLGVGCALSSKESERIILPSETEQSPEPAVFLPTPTPEEVIETQASEEEVQVSPPPPAPPHVVTIGAGDFFFEPSVLTVKTGETVIIQFGEITGNHVFAIDDLGISEVMATGGSVTFTAPETPVRFTYYCSVGPHRTLGMVGTLIVE